MSDRTLTCSDCGNEFVFTAGEQEFYAQRGYTEPRRCQPCRQARKAQRSHDDGGFGGAGGFRAGGGGGGPRQFYPAVCSECGQETEVPFSPTPGKPVYCRDCFQSRRGPRYSAY